MQRSEGLSQKEDSLGSASSCLSGPATKLETHGSLKQMNSEGNYDDEALPRY